MKCLRCGNEDPSYFYLGAKGYYCRKCIRFKRLLLEEDLEAEDYAVNRADYQYFTDYTLTAKQAVIAQKCLEVSRKSDVLLYCVCGAGKTNILIPTISAYLREGKRVAFAIARREVVKEIYERLRLIFKNARVIAVYGGHHQKLFGDIIVLTTHQLYRYYQTFDLLILDEADAFPFAGDQVLNNIALNSSKGQVIYSTATIDETLKKMLARRSYQTLALYARPHGHPLVLPQVIKGPFLLLLFLIYRELKQSEGHYILFVESKALCKRLYRLFASCLSITYVYSDLAERDRNINAFKARRYRHIIATTVLERGITLDAVDVMILHRYPNIFRKTNFIQMLGRVGRSFAHPGGKAFIYTSFNDPEIKKTLTELKYANAMSLL